MGTTVFTWAPDYQPQAQHQPNVHVVQFGDNYEQRVQPGLNADKQKWTLAFTGRPDSEASEIAGFLKDRGALDSFFWTAPGDALPLKWKCPSWSRSPTNGTGLATDGSLQALWTINANFEQVFEP